MTINTMNGTMPAPHTGATGTPRFPGIDTRGAPLSEVFADSANLFAARTVPSNNPSE